MRHEDFQPQSPGSLVRTTQGYWAYVPAPLPPDLNPGWDLVMDLSRADRALSELAGIGRTLPNPHLLIGPFIRREAVLSSRIEGTQASLSDLFYFEAAPESVKPSSDVPEVANYVTALEHGLARLADVPVTLRVVREMHERLMSGVRGEDKRPGEFRASQNWIGSPGSHLDSATYVPPPPVEMLEALRSLERFINEPPNLPLLIRLAMVHYQFEAIHPFRDGNGRIGRLLISLILCAERALPAPLLYLSAFFERHRGDYYDLLLGVSTAGHWEEWIRFFLRGVAEQAADAVNRSNRLLEYWQMSRHRLQAGRSPGMALRLLDSLFSSLVVSVGSAALQLGVTPRAAQQNIDRLVAVGILHEVTGRQRNRLYVAREILIILESPIANAHS